MQPPCMVQQLGTLTSADRETPVGFSHDGVRGWEGVAQRWSTQISHRRDVQSSGNLRCPPQTERDGNPQHWVEIVYM